VNAIRMQAKSSVFKAFIKVSFVRDSARLPIREMTGMQVIGIADVFQ